MLLYIGNFLEQHGKTPNFNGFLISKFRQQFDVDFASEKNNKLLRLFDMNLKIWNCRKRANLVLIDAFSSNAFWFAWSTAMLCRVVRIPYVNILRGGALPDRLKASPAACKSLFGNAAANVSPSLYLEEAFSKNGFAVSYIPNFIDLKNYHFKGRKELRPRLLWVRSFHQIYNAPMAVEVLKSLKKNYPDAVLCMVGPDNDGTRQIVEQRAKALGVEDSLILTGKLDKKEWIKLSEDYDIFINSTNYDNHPVSLLEAMGLGLPLVSTNVGGIPFLVEDGKEGILVPPQNPEAFSDAIRELLSHPARALQMAREARKKVESLDWEVLGEKWLAVIKNASHSVAS